jgi:hypothetical protein
MSSNDRKLIAVIGATGHQGGAVVRALQAGGQFKVRALTRSPGKHRELAEEVVEADLDRAETLKAAFDRAHGVFLVTNFWEEGTDELKQATAAVRAAKDAGVKHFVWSTLPDAEAISGGKFHVHHFTDKARIDRIVKDAALRIIRLSSHLFSIRILRAPWLRKSRKTEIWAGFFRLTQLCAASTWATFANSATSLPEHSHCRIKRAMGSICPSSVIS